MKNKYFRGAHVSEVKFREVLRYFVIDIPATNAAQISGLNRNTLQSIYTRLRHRVVGLACAEAEQMTGKVEIDESYFGAWRVRGKRGRGAGGKIPVIGLLKRGGKVFTAIVEGCSKAELMPVIRHQVASGSTLYTDGWKSYDGLILDGYKHHRVHHQSNEFARGTNHINGIESFWAYAKHRMIKLKGIRKDKFHLHLKESEFRFNHRNDNLYTILLSNIRLNPL